MPIALLTLWREGVEPWAGAFEGRTGREDVGIGEAASDDLQAHRQAVVRHAGRDGRRRVAGVVEQVRRAPTDQRVDLDAVDLGGADGVAIVGVVDRQTCQGRADDQVVIGEDALYRIVDLRADLLVTDEVQSTHLVAGVDPSQILGGQVVTVIVEHVGTVVLEHLEGLQVDRNDESTPQVAELTLVPRDAQRHLVDVRARLLERRRSVADDRRDPRVDREDDVVGGVGNANSLDGTAHRGHGVDALIKGVRVGRVVAGERVERQRGVLEGPRQRSLEQERVGAAERIGPRQVRHAPERRLVAVHTTPRRGDADRPAAVGALGDRQKSVGHRGAAATR